MSSKISYKSFNLPRYLQDHLTSRYSLPYTHVVCTRERTWSYGISQLVVEYYEHVVTAGYRKKNIHMACLSWQVNKISDFLLRKRKRVRGTISSSPKLLQLFLRQYRNSDARLEISVIPPDLFSVVIKRHFLANQRSPTLINCLSEAWPSMRLLVTLLPKHFYRERLFRYDKETRLNRQSQFLQGCIPY